jgi:hypothetical protein
MVMFDAVANPSHLTFVDLHVSQVRLERAVSPSWPAISQGVGHSGGQGKRAATRSHLFAASNDEHGEHWTLPTQRLIRPGVSEFPLGQLRVVCVSLAC